MQRILILVVFSFFVVSTTFSQNDVLQKEITFRAINRDLSNVLVDLSKESGINIVFNIREIPEKYIKMYAPGYTLESILDYILKDTGLKYDVINNQIVIYKPQVDNEGEFQIYGTIYDSKTGEKLIYTNVYLDDFSRGTLSNEYGYYSITLPKGENSLNFSFLGYKTKKVSIDVQKDFQLDVSLVPEEAKLLDEVLITDSKLETRRIDFFNPPKINMSKIEKMVHLFGEDDVLRYIYTKSGVLSGTDGFGGMHVRGGNSGENQIILDGVPIYNSIHAIGLFSIFNSSTIKDAKFVKNSFPARYGGNLSSFLDIRTIDGNNKKYGYEIELGLMTLKGLVEGPIVKGKSSFFISFRRTYIDIWDQQISGFLSSTEKTKDFSYFFYDFNAKTNFKLNNNNSLFLSFYKGIDNFFNKDVLFHTNTDTIAGISKNEWKWGNNLLSLQWNSRINTKNTLTTTTYFSRYIAKSYSYDVNHIDEQMSKYLYDGRIMDSQIKNYGLKVDFDYFANKYNKIKWGAHTVLHAIEPLVYVNSQLLSNVPKEIPTSGTIRTDISPFKAKGLESRVYFEDGIKFNEKSNLNLGFQFSHYINLDNTEKEQFFSFEPRIIFAQKLNDIFILNFSIVKMSQYLHAISNNGLGLSVHNIIPLSKILPPENSWQANIGFNATLSDKSFIELNGYYKISDNLISHKDGSYFIISQYSNWQNTVPVGKGKMYGLEFSWNYNSRKVQILLNYTLAQSLRSYDEILDGKWFEYRFSRRHNINLNTIWKFSKRMSFYLNAKYGTGNPYTLPTQLTPEGTLLYEEKNNWKLPDYQRIDVGFETKFHQEDIMHELKFGIYNVLNHTNPIYLTYSLKDNTLLSSNFKQVYVFPLIPSISYKIKF